ncbi:hypothetical protein NQ176_g3177 [Zarea fungicola]|uniref:Uncharacterized protein n=1 Tax=Zarea fungicola TaxID=93591 RepID=A0ACC1NM17_9HYPO|nr:hypothetical protein NQ176_g3177 [Lecanicillium fungicola]
MVVIHDRYILNELLEKHSLATSGRPQMRFAGDLCGFNRYLFTSDYNAFAREQRKVMHREIGTDKLARRFEDSQDIESRRLLLRTLNHPKQLFSLHVPLLTSAIILKIVYGYTTSPDGRDPLLDLVNTMAQNISKSYVPLSWPVDIFPWLIHVPEWVPGLKFKSIARYHIKVSNLVNDVPWRFVERKISTGDYKPSIVSSFLETFAENDASATLEAVEAVKYAAAMLHFAGAETSITAIRAFLFAMVTNPDIQNLAQQEIDGIVGNERLPDLGDRERLPYVSALIKETLRWHAITPMGVAHRTSEELILRGYRIPKGSYIMAANRSLLHDPKEHYNPSLFDPSRFLPPRNETNDSIKFVFGFGRRVCPGEHIAQQTLFLTISRLLATFTIGKVNDVTGEPIEPILRCGDDVLARVEEFPFSITPRSEIHARLIQQVDIDYPMDSGDAELLEIPDWKEQS